VRERSCIIALWKQTRPNGVVREKRKANIGILTKKSKDIKIGNLSHITLAHLLFV
jgi:hypothetical protein